jgi:multidrug efflux system membrane fusion protein
MKALLPNEDERLWPGEFVHVLINLPSLSNALVVPTIAVQQDQNQQYYVYVVDKNNRAQMRHVALGPSQNEQTSILSGVNLGEKVITKGQFEITHGSLVQVSKIG